ncbi:MAG: hypothetical protein ACFB8W_21910 [Elainellaceae cyanobacterium]
MNPRNFVLWDFAGVDGLQAAIALFSSGVTHLAPFQSLTVAFEAQPGSVLRLCEGNFRVALREEVDFEGAIASLGLKVWVKPCRTANLVMPPTLGLERLAQVATTKPLFTLHPFPCDRAVPARINGTAILAWHHFWEGQPRLLIQTAAADAGSIQRALTGDASGFGNF